jgi:3-oxoadipate enol-lactonase
MTFNPDRRRFLAASGTLALGACASPTFTPAPSTGSPVPITGFAAVNGTRLYYEMTGSGPPLVLLHGFTFDTRMWDEQFTVLARDFRVIRYDARGFGRSAMPALGERYLPADDLAALLAVLDAKDPHLVGLAMGARFALDFAVTHPAKHRSLVLIDGVIGGWQWSQDWLASYAPIIEAGRNRDISRAKALWLGHALFAPARERPAVAGRLKRIIDDYSGWHFVQPNLERPITPPVMAQLDKIRVPTLVLVGGRDLPDFQRMADHLARNVANARRFVIPGAGHVANMEAPDAVNDAIRGFLLRAA